MVAPNGGVLLHQKKILRQKYLKLRLGLTQNDLFVKSQSIFANLLSFIEKNHFRKVFLFSSIKKEPEMISFFVQKKRSFEIAAPLVTGPGTMEFYRFSDLTDLSRGSYGIYEPKADPQKRLEPTDGSSLVCVPGVAFTKNGHRLGYGGGFYDRYLSRYPSCLSVGVAFENLIASQLEVTEQDYSLDFICTEKSLWSAKDAKI